VVRDRKQKKEKERLQQRLLDSQKSDPESPPPKSSRGPQRRPDTPEIIFVGSDSPTPEDHDFEDSPVQVPLPSNQPDPEIAPPRPPEADTFELPDEDIESTIILDPGEPETPRTAAAKASLSPNPDKRPPGGAPGLLWSGSQNDLSGKMKASRSELREQSEVVQRGPLSEALSDRSFRMPKENVSVGEGTAAADGAASSFRVTGTSFRQVRPPPPPPRPAPPPPMPPRPVTATTIARTATVPTTTTTSEEVPIDITDLDREGSTISRT